LPCSQTGADSQARGQFLQVTQTEIRVVIQRELRGRKGSRDGNDFKLLKQVIESILKVLRDNAIRRRQGKNVQRGRADVRYLPYCDIPGCPGCEVPQSERLCHGNSLVKQLTVNLVRQKDHTACQLAVAIDPEHEVRNLSALISQQSWTDFQSLKGQALRPHLPVNPCR